MKNTLQNCVTGISTVDDLNQLRKANEWMGF